MPFNVMSYVEYKILIKLPSIIILFFIPVLSQLLIICFIDFIFDLDLNEHFSINLLARIEEKENINYIKLEKNQIMILDALMKHGGYTKKYYDIICIFCNLCNGVFNLMVL